MRTFNLMLAAAVGIAMTHGIASADPALQPPAQGNLIVRPGGMVGLNPQPEPPSAVVKPGSEVGLNPQPEPPSRRKLFRRPGGLVGLNPQPEPPSVGSGIGAGN
jgi:hypothetical protein